MASLSRSLRADLQRELDRLTGLGGIERVPGIVLAVFDGEELHQWASGRAGDPRDSELTPGTLFRIASITKSYTATMVMQLVDEGKVDLDRPIVAQLPEFRLADPAATAAITPRHLLAHTSGVPGDWGFDGGRGDDAVARYVASLAELRAVFPPGLMHSYSNAGYVVLGRLVEHVTGETWDACLQRRLARPMGLERTVTLPEDVLLHPYALGRQTDAEAGALTSMKWRGNRASGPCGIISAASADVITFARMHLADGLAPNGERLLSAGACRLMREAQVRLTPHAGTEAWGLGFEVSEPDGRLVFGHGGSTAGQTGALKLVPDRGGAVLLQTNSDAGRARCDDVFRSVLREWFGVELEAALVAPSDPPAPDLDRWVGVYERVDTRFEVRRAESGGLEATITTLRAYGGVQPPPARTVAMTPYAEGVFLVQPPGSPRPFPAVFREWGTAGTYLHLGLRSAPRTA